MKPSFYTLTTALLLGTLGATAQVYHYDFDSSFALTGIRKFSAGSNHAEALSGYLLNDGKSYVASTVTDAIGNPALSIGARLKANGDFDSTLCGSYCSSGTPQDARATGIYQLGTSPDYKYYFSSTGFGGNVLFSGATTFDDQTYSTSYTICVASAQMNDSIVLGGGVESGDGIILCYKANPVGAGYAGATGIITGATYPHGGIVAPFMPSITTVGVAHLAVQSTGKILSAGHVNYTSGTDSTAYICRFKANTLSLDSTFGTYGIVYIGAPSTTPATINAMYVAPDNRVYVHYKEQGSSNTYLMALNADGTYYTAFGTSGQVNTGTTRINKMKMVGGKLICGLQGAPGNDVAWSYNADGTADTSFHAGTNALSLGSYVSGGSNFVVNDISANAAGDILLAGRFDNATPKREGMVVKLVKKLRYIPGPTGVAAAYSKDLSLYPNPASTLLYVDVPGNDAAQVRIAAVDGALVLSETVSAGQPLSISTLAPGMYFVHLTSGGNTYTARFVKQ